MNDNDIQPMCRHRPVSNGWSAGGGAPPVTWCGRCKTYVAVDEEWVNHFYDTQRTRARGYERNSQRALASIEADRVYLLRLVKETAA